MPRTVSLTALRAAMAQESQEVYVTLLKITHPDITTLYRCDNTETVVHGGQNYLPAAFKFQLPSDESEREPVSQLMFPNVDRDLIDEIRGIQGGPVIEVKIVLASSPATVEYGPVNLKVKSVSYNAMWVTMQLGFDPFAGEPVPWVKFTPEWFPGMFA